MSTTLDSNKRLVEESIQAISTGDRETFIENHAEDCVLHSGNETVHGIEEIADRQFDRAGIADLDLTPEEVIAEGDVVAARWVVRGTDERTGERFAVVHLGQFHIEEGTCVEVWVASGNRTANR